MKWLSLDAPLFSTAIVTSTVADGFSAISFSGNSGNQNWSSAWQELGEADGPAPAMSEGRQQFALRIGQLLLANRRELRTSRAVAHCARPI